METKKVTYFVRECMEFPSLGIEERDIPTIEKAREVYNALPATTKNMIHGIGITVDDWDYDIFHNGKVDYDALEYMDKKILEMDEVQMAIRYLEESDHLLCRVKARTR